MQKIAQNDGQSVSRSFPLPSSFPFVRYRGRDYAKALLIELEKSNREKESTQLESQALLSEGEVLRMEESRCSLSDSDEADLDKNMLLQLVPNERDAISFNCPASSNVLMLTSDVSTIRESFFLCFQSHIELTNFNGP